MFEYFCMRSRRRTEKESQETYVEEIAQELEKGSEQSVAIYESATHAHTDVLGVHESVSLTVDQDVWLTGVEVGGVRKVGGATDVGGVSGHKEKGGATKKRGSKDEKSGGVKDESTNDDDLEVKIEVMVSSEDTEISTTLTAVHDCESNIVRLNDPVTLHPGVTYKVTVCDRQSGSVEWKVHEGRLNADGRVRSASGGKVKVTMADGLERGVMTSLLFAPVVVHRPPSSGEWAAPLFQDNHVVEFSTGACLTEDCVVFTVDSDTEVSNVEVTGPCVLGPCVLDTKLTIKLFDISDTELSSTSCTVAATNCDKLHFLRVKLVTPVKLVGREPYKVTVSSQQDNFQLQRWWWGRPGVTRSRCADTQGVSGRVLRRVSNHPGWSTVTNLC